MHQFRNEQLCVSHLICSSGFNQESFNNWQWGFRLTGPRDPLVLTSAEPQPITRQRHARQHPDREQSNTTVWGDEASWNFVCSKPRVDTATAWADVFVIKPYVGSPLEQNIKGTACSKLKFHSFLLPIADVDGGSGDIFWSTGPILSCTEGKDSTHWTAIVVYVSNVKINR